MNRRSRTAAGKACRLGLSLLASAVIFQAACRTAPPRTAAGAAPVADRHAPFDFTARKAMVVAAHPLAVEDLPSEEELKRLMQEENA